MVDKWHLVIISEIGTWKKASLVKVVFKYSCFDFVDNYL